MKKARLLSFLLFLAFLCQAQADSLYVRPYDQKLMLIGFVAKDILFLGHEVGKREFMYMPNNPVELGLGFSWNNTILSAAYGYGFDFMRDKELGKTESFDFQFHNYGRKFVFDLFVQRYKGFYMEEDNAGGNFVLCPDLSIRQYGINGQYILNSKRFSYKAAFAQSERQERSAGSVIFGAGIYSTRIYSDSSFVYNDKHDLSNFQFGISAGYAYTWVLGKYWYINGSATVGIHFGSESAKRFGKDKLQVSPTVFPRIAVGYDRDSWALGFSFISNITSPAFTDDDTLTLISGSFQLTYCTRIADVPFLSWLLK